MGDFRKYACDQSGILFKEVHRKGIRREILSRKLGISENQLKNYAYDSTKSATLENFLQVIVEYKCVNVLDKIASDMDCCVYELPKANGNKKTTAETASEAMFSSSKAINTFLDAKSNKEEKSKDIREAIITLLQLEKSLA